MGWYYVGLRLLRGFAEDLASRPIMGIWGFVRGLYVGTK